MRGAARQLIHHHKLRILMQDREWKLGLRDRRRVLGIAGWLRELHLLPGSTVAPLRPMRPSTRTCPLRSSDEWRRATARYDGPKQVQAVISSAGLTVKDVSFMGWRSARAKGWSEKRRASAGGAQTGASRVARTRVPAGSTVVPEGICSSACTPSIERSMPEPCQASRGCPQAVVRRRGAAFDPSPCEVQAVAIGLDGLGQADPGRGRETSAAATPHRRRSAGRTNSSKLTIDEAGLPGRPNHSTRRAERPLPQSM